MSIYDDSDFDELIIKHLLRSNQVYEKAKALKLTGDDLLSSHIAGIQLYKELANLSLELGPSPIDRTLLEMHIRQKKTTGQISGIDNDDLTTLINWCYSSDINPQYIESQLLPFIKHRRLNKAALANRAEPVVAYQEMHKLAIGIAANNTESQIDSIKPFAQIVQSQTIQGVTTGFPEIDAKMGGLAAEECGLLIGHSGTGKTAVASVIAHKAAIAGFKVLYISLEEPKENIINRWYAAHFQINYTTLHYGQEDARGQLEIGFNNMTPEDKEALVSNLDIIDARKLTPICADEIAVLIDKKAEEGFIPDLVILDQMDYMKPNVELNKNANKWEKYEQVAFDCDKLSQHHILEADTFALWVLHQAKGQMKWEFGYDEIASFRGIVKPFDVSLGIGRHDKDSPYINLFSMKVRHTQHFRQSYRAYFEYMSFVKTNWSPQIEQTTNAGLREKRVAK